MFFIVNDVTGCKLRKNCTDRAFANERGAKISLAAYLRNNPEIDPGIMKIMSEDRYLERFPVRMVERVNVMTGQKYFEPENTPICCSPASETYWSM